MNEVVGQQEWRSSVRGQCFSFIMPWAQIIREYNSRMHKGDLAALPRGENVLQYLFRIHLRVAGQSFERELKQIRLRPCVLVHLLCFLYERRPDLFAKQNQTMPILAGRVREVIETAVHKRYPELESHKPVSYTHLTLPTILLV